VGRKVDSRKDRLKRTPDWHPVGSGDMAGTTPDPYRGDADVRGDRTARYWVVTGPWSAL